MHNEAASQWLWRWGYTESGWDLPPWWTGCQGNSPSQLTLTSRFKTKYGEWMGPKLTVCFHSTDFKTHSSPAHPLIPSQEATSSFWDPAALFILTLAAGATSLRTWGPHAASQGLPTVRLVCTPRSPGRLSQTTQLISFLPSARLQRPQRGLENWFIKKQ